MAYKRIVNGLGMVEFLCCKIVRIVNRYGSQIAATATADEKSALSALVAAATVYCDIRRPDPA